MNWFPMLADAGGHRTKLSLHFYGVTRRRLQLDIFEHGLHRVGKAG